MILQKLLGASYQGDSFIRDTLLTAINIPEIEASLRARMPRPSQQLANRVANRPSDKPRTAGALVAWSMLDIRQDKTSNKPESKETNEMYSIDRGYVKTQHDMGNLHGKRAIFGIIGTPDQKEGDSAHSGCEE